MKIAGEYTSEHWKALHAELVHSPSESLWDFAYRSFYRARIDTRYLSPIGSIQESNVESGEGFAIVALFCTLIEFLESCERGYNFRLLKKGEKFEPFEYGPRQAEGYFKDFLKTRKPFSPQFPSSLIDSFYRDVRCGLLHEAQTKGGWIISATASSGALVSEKGAEIKLFRNQLVPWLEEYFADYRMRLLADFPDTRDAFRRKFNHLCKG